MSVPSPADKPETTVGNEKRDRKHQFEKPDLSPRDWLYVTFRAAPPEPMEFFCGMVALLWGLWVMMPWWDMFAVSPTIYRVLLFFIADEFIWGFLSAAVGFNMLSGLYRDNRKQRYWSCFALTSLWGAFVPAFLFSDWRGFGWLFYLLLTATAYWLTRRTHDRLMAQKDGWTLGG